MNVQHTPSSPTVNLLVAFQDGALRTVRDFQDLRGAKARPTDLTCPQCEKPVTVKLSPIKQIADHFAHLPGSDCALRNGGESAAHLNAKAGLALRLSQFHNMALSIKCRACQNWDNYFRVSDYDEVVPELKLGKRRPDISILSATQTIGAAEVKHTHGVSAEKQYDLNSSGVQWFEIPTAGAHKKFYNVYPDANLFTINARDAEVIYPAPPDYCEVCTHFKRKEAEKFAHEKAFQKDLFRLPIQERVGLDRAAQEAAVARLLEREARTKEEQDKWEQADGPARINASGELIIPTRSIYKYRYWAGGQTLWATLEELNAPLAVWRRYAARDEALLTAEHLKRCTQPAKRGNGFAYCTDCGYWLEEQAKKEAVYV